MANADVDAALFRVRQVINQSTNLASSSSWLPDIGGIEGLFKLAVAAPTSDVVDRALTLAFRGDEGLKLLTSPTLLPFLLIGLTGTATGNVPLKLLTLRQIQTLVPDAAGRAYLNHNLLSVLLAMTRDASLAVLQQLTKLFAAMVQHEDGVAAFYAPASIATIVTGYVHEAKTMTVATTKIVIAGDEEEQLRVLSLCSDVGTASAISFAAYQRSGLLAALLAALRVGTDVLVQLNVVSMVARLVESVHGRTVVTSTDLWATLMSLADVPEDVGDLDPFAPLLIAAIAKLIASLAHTYNTQQDASHDWSHARNLPVFFRSLMRVPDEPVRTATVSAMCNVASSLHGLLLLSPPVTTAAAAAATDSSASVLNVVAPLMQSGVEDLQIASFHGYANILNTTYDSKTGEPSAPATSSSSSSSSPAAATPATATTATATTSVSTTAAPAPALLAAASAAQQRLFSSIGAEYGREPMEVIMQYIATPFEDVRCAALHVLASVARHPWGLTYFKSRGGFFEFLTNRDTETTKLGADWKYLIIKNIVNNPAYVASLSAPARAHLSQFYDDGPFYSKREARVADPIRLPM